MDKFVKLLIIGVLTLIFSGSIALGKDSKDINDKLLATTIAVDRKDGEIWFFVEFANIQAKEDGGNEGTGMGLKYFVVKGHGATLSEARKSLDVQLDMPIYLGGVRTLLITEDFAKEDLVEYLYRLRADETYRKKVITLITKDDLDTLYTTINDQSLSLGYSIENTILTLESSGEAFSRTTSRLLENLSEKYTGILIPCIGLQDTSTALKGYCVVYDTKVVGFIPLAACDGLNLLKVEKARADYTIDYKQYQLTVDTVLSKRRIEPNYSDGKITFTISLKFNATLKYGNTKTPYGLTDEDSKAIETIMKDKIKNQVLAAVYQAQHVYKTDYFQFDDAFRTKYPVVFESVDWSKEFSKIDVTPIIEVSLTVDEMMDYKTDKKE